MGESNPLEMFDLFTAESGIVIIIAVIIKNEKLTGILRRH
jgi:hypothetical protein